jgi:ABC-type transport system substrate-binding protein
VKTVCEKNPDWRGLEQGRHGGNAERVEHRPIANAATRMAALKSGEIDFPLDTSVQDVPRQGEDRDIRVWEGDETRVIHQDTGRGDTSDGNFRNPEVDALMRKAGTEMDPAKRRGPHQRRHPLAARGRERHPAAPAGDAVGVARQRERGPPFRQLAVAALGDGPVAAPLPPRRRRA